MGVGIKLKTGTEESEPVDGSVPGGGFFAGGGEAPLNPSPHSPLLSRPQSLRDQPGAKRCFRLSRFVVFLCGTIVVSVAG